MRRLKEIRIKRGLSAEHMAKALGLKTTNAYYKKENGKIKISTDEAKIISKELGVPFEKIF
ncbi:helix-turn-helix transcriptional regulator [Eubacterium maltosivorans]|uniref:helix-turn-helix transcriptional regulator n=1 Tax=Eubacterium maltosivorans TaxID=2041044 RepID=UPI00189CB07D|nr:helix-turn-helix transcriptional regulator [Eubacterium maltosivorans]